MAAVFAEMQSFFYKFSCFHANGINCNLNLNASDGKMYVNFSAELKPFPVQSEAPHIPSKRQKPSQIRRRKRRDKARCSNMNSSSMSEEERNLTSVGDSDEMNSIEEKADTEDINFSDNDVSSSSHTHPPTTAESDFLLLTCPQNSTLISLQTNSNEKSTLHDEAQDFTPAQVQNISEEDGSTGSLTFGEFKKIMEQFKTDFNESLKTSLL